MATLQNIRNKSGLLLAVIGIAMLAFILGDLLKSTNSGGGSNIVGEVMGEDVLIQNFQTKVDEGIENWKSQNQQKVLTQSTIGQIREQIWNQYVNELIMLEEYSKLGIEISDDEFFERIQGTEVHPEISKVPSFLDPVTGVFDRARVIGYLKQIDEDQTGEARARWNGFQDYLIGVLKSEKYNSLVGKAMFVSSKEAQNASDFNLRKRYFDYVSIPYSSIENTIVEPTISELKSFYEENKSDYTQKQSKDVDFVVYSVVPSIEDDMQTKTELANLVLDFKSEIDYELMARRNSDNTNSRFIFSKSDELQDSKWIDLFNAKQGTVIGPYLTSKGVYRIAKLAEIQSRPDSVEARHILIAPNQNRTLDSVNNIINDLKLQIENGTNFGDLAVKYSEDPGSNTKILRGSLGWFSEGAMVNEFNEICFTANKKDLNIVNTQFGVHLIQVTKKSKSAKKVKIAYIDRIIEPSTETFNTYYSKAASFVGQVINDGISFDTLVEKNNLVKRSDSKVVPNKLAISGLPNSREMVRWLNKSDLNAVSEVFQFDNSYVVATVKSVNEEGEIDFDDVKEQITTLVIKEKKGVKISQSILKVSSLTEIAKTNGTTIVSNQNATFSNDNLVSIGYEPELLGSIFGSKIGDISSPIIGRNAVYVIQVNSEDEAIIGNNSQQKKQLKNQEISNANRATINVLKDAADVKDYRVDFF
ncbi:SurA N-terminal domain-containing protein [Flavobacteriales bacterium]|nr:SurA N-terminal domain-containing protein [Flavobacteriales bacterium]